MGRERYDEELMDNFLKAFDERESLKIDLENATLEQQAQGAYPAEEAYLALLGLPDGCQHLLTIPAMPGGRRRKHDYGVVKMWGDFKYDLTDRQIDLILELQQRYRYSNKGRRRS